MKRYLFAAITLIVIGTFPYDFQDHTHWDRVGWIPFVSPPIKIIDIVVNVVLFTPLGAAVAANTRSKWSMPAAIGAAMALSLVMETGQLYSHGRFPSATDFVCNVTGAALGARVLLHGLRSRRMDDSSSPAEG